MNKIVSRIFLATIAVLGFVLVNAVVIHCIASGENCEHIGVETMICGDIKHYGDGWDYLNGPCHVQIQYVKPPIFPG